MQSFRFARSLVIALAMMLSFSSAHSQNLSRAESADESISIPVSSLAISIVTFGAGVPVLSGVRSNFAESKSRGDFKSETVLQRQFGLPQEVSIVDDMLKGTSPGDVIRLEYTVYHPKTLEIAKTELKKSLIVWDERVRGLKATGEALEAHINTLSAQAEATGPSLRMVKLQNELKNLSVVYEDAKMRLATVTRSYHEATDALERIRRLGSMYGMHSKRYHIQRDILVAEDTRKVLEGAFKKYNLGLSGSRNLTFNNVSITRTHIPNESLAARHLMRARTGVAGLVVMAGLVAEEVVFNYLGRSLEDSFRGQPAPEARTVPRSQVQ